MHVKSIFACTNRVLMHEVRHFKDTKVKASSTLPFSIYTTVLSSALLWTGMLPWDPCLRGKAHAVVPDGKALSS